MNTILNNNRFAAMQNNQPKMKQSNKKCRQKGNNKKQKKHQRNQRNPIAKKTRTKRQKVCVKPK